MAAGCWLSCPSYALTLPSPRGRGTPPLERDLGADALLARPLQDQVGGRDVLDRDPDRLVDRDLVVRAPARLLADRDLADLVREVVGRELALVHWDQQVARLLQVRLARVDDDVGFANGLAVELARRRRVRPD